VVSCFGFMCCTCLSHICFLYVHISCFIFDNRASFKGEFLPASYILFYSLYVLSSSKTHNPGIVTFRPTYISWDTYRLATYTIHRYLYYSIFIFLFIHVFISIMVTNPLCRYSCTYLMLKLLCILCLFSVLRLSIHM